MESLKQALRACRERAGLTRQELATRVEVSPQYIAALESDDDKVPSLELLRKLVRAFVTAEVDQRSTAGEANRTEAVNRIVSQIAFAAINPFPESVSEGLSPITAEEEVSLQASGRAPEIWILSDTLLEAQSEDLAAQTAANIRNGAIYCFFVPFAMPSSHWTRALGAIERAGPDRSLNEVVAVYQISNCAFSARLRITNPRGQPQARYGLSLPHEPHFLYYEAPLDVVVRAVSTLGELRLMADAPTAGTDPSFVRELGAAYRAFPRQRETGGRYGA